MGKLMSRGGFALLSAMMLMLVMGLLLVSFYMITHLDIDHTKASLNYEKTFVAAEAALNIRAEEFRIKFENFTQPSGTSPSSTDPCVGSNLGSGDFACQSKSFGAIDTQSYVTEQAGFPTTVTIPAGETYEGLYAFEYRYDVFSEARNSSGNIGSILGLRFKSRVVPIFQFAAFYNKDLEITPTANMTIGGPIHTNNNLYINTSATLTINGQVTVNGDIYRGRKRANQCYTGTIQVTHATPVTPIDLANFTSFAVSSDYSCNGSNRTYMGDEDFTEWNGKIEQQTTDIQIPTFDNLANPEGTMWDLADLRLVLSLDSSNNVVTTYSSTGVEARSVANTIDTTVTDQIDVLCSGTPVYNTMPAVNNLYDQLRGAYIRVLEVDLQSLLTCLHQQSILSLDDDTQDGLIFHFTVEGPDSDTINDYGVRIRNASSLAVSGAPTIQGLTIVSDQPVYLYGDFNTTNKKPASIYTDAVTMLSNNWVDSLSDNPMYQRNASDTTVNSAIVTGTITTGGAEGVAGHDSSPNSAGLNNLPRLLEDWDGDGGPVDTLTILGSFVSLSTTAKAAGSISTGSHYTVPERDFSFDTDFNNPDNLPPGAISFTYLRQILFSREFEQ